MGDRSRGSREEFSPPPFVRPPQVLPEPVRLRLEALSKVSLEVLFDKELSKSYFLFCMGFPQKYPACAPLPSFIFARNLKTLV